MHALVGAGYELTRVLAFELDSQNYRERVHVWGHLPDAVFAPCGIAERTALASFAVGAGAASGLSADGKVLCQCVALDDFAPAFPAQLIKLDVEGAEPGALRGARRPIKRHRPRLAVNACHELAHLWEIVRMIAGWELLSFSGLQEVVWVV